MLLRWLGIIWTYAAFGEEIGYRGYPIVRRLRVLRIRCSEPSFLKSAPHTGRQVRRSTDRLLVSGARILARLFEFFGGGVEWLLAVLSVVSFGCLVFAVLLYFTGRGVHASRGVARTMGILLVILPLLVSFMGVMALRKPVPFVVSSLTFALSTYVIWALGGASAASIHSRRECPKCHASKTGSLWLWLLWP
jgi:hypothetical protein